MALFVCFCDYHAGIPENKTEAVRLYHDAATKGTDAAVQRLKALHLYRPKLTSTDKGMCTC